MQCAGGHLFLTLAVGAINLLWLLPVAWLVATGRFEGLFGLLIAYTPLMFLAVKLHAGVPSAGSSGCYGRPTNLIGTK